MGRVEKGRRELSLKPVLIFLPFHSNQLQFARAKRSKYTKNQIFEFNEAIASHFQGADQKVFEIIILFINFLRNLLFSRYE